MVKIKGAEVKGDLKVEGEIVITDKEAEPVFKINYDSQEECLVFQFLEEV